MVGEPPQKHRRRPLQQQHQSHRRHATQQAGGAARDGVRATAAAGGGDAGRPGRRIPAAFHGTTRPPSTAQHRPASAGAAAHAAPARHGAHLRMPTIAMARFKRMPAYNQSLTPGRAKRSCVWRQGDGARQDANMRLGTGVADAGGTRSHGLVSASRAGQTTNHRAHLPSVQQEQRARAGQQRCQRPQRQPRFTMRQRRHRREHAAKHLGEGGEGAGEGGAGQRLGSRPPMPAQRAPSVRSPQKNRGRQGERAAARRCRAQSGLDGSKHRRRFCLFAGLLELRGSHPALEYGMQPNGGIHESPRLQSTLPAAAEARNR